MNGLILFPPNGRQILIRPLQMKLHPVICHWECISDIPVKGWVGTVECLSYGVSVRPAQLGPVRALGQTALFLTTYISHILFNKCQGTLAQLREMVALICK